MKKMFVSFIMMIVMFGFVCNSFSSTNESVEVEKKAALFLEMVYTGNEDIVPILFQRKNYDLIMSFLYNKAIEYHMNFSNWAGKTWTQEKTLKELNNVTIDLSEMNFKWDEQRKLMTLSGTVTVIRPTFGKQIEKWNMPLPFYKDNNEWFMAGQ